MMKSSTDMVKAVSAPDTMPGLISGITTRQKACIQVQPRSWAASMRFRSICRSFGPTDRMTYGMLKQTWAISRVPKPMVSRSGSTTADCQEFTHPAKAPQPLKNTTNSRHRLTPVTISAFIMGMLLTELTMARRRRLMAYRPMAANVPAMAATMVDSSDTIRVVYTLFMIRRLDSRDSYHFREKPFQTLELVPALKEKTMRMIMGA